ATQAVEILDILEMKSSQKFDMDGKALKTCCLRRLKVMKLRYCCILTTTLDFSEITSLEVLDLEGCVNLVTVHPSIGMLNRLALNMRDCRRATNFPSKVEMDSL
ncbi:NB-ARC domains-containing protein, partial [Tanacetum coccineum]